MIARLPNVLVLNGGDEISEIEREQAERAFIRFYLDLEPGSRPSRWSILSILTINVTQNQRKMYQNRFLVLDISK